MSQNKQKKNLRRNAYKMKKIPSIYKRIVVIAIYA